MSESQPSKVFMFDDSDPEMQRAYEKARATFRYFWREVAWERRRIVPGKSLALPKARRRGQNSKKTAQLNMLLLPITFQPRPTFLTMLARCERVRIAALHLPTARRIDWGF